MSPDDPKHVLSVIVPVFNEARTLDQALLRLGSIPQQTVAIDDGSTDESPQILRRWVGLSGRNAIFRSVNRGKGQAIRTGMDAAKAEFVVVQDADLEYDPSDLPQLLARLLDGSADLVLGSRYMNGHVPGTSIFFRLGVFVLNLAVRLLYGVKLTDEATCYKMLRTDVLRRMDLQCERFEFCPEVIAKAARLGLRIVEVPISYHPRNAKAGKKIRLRDGWAALRTLWRWRKWEPDLSLVNGHLSLVGKDVPRVGCALAHAETAGTRNALPNDSCTDPSSDACAKAHPTRGTSFPTNDK
jgi:dolichol-phosphate mannosyltransferase